MSADVEVRPLDASAQQALAIARLVAVELAPYLAHALFAVRPVAADGLGTLAVDRSWRLYVDPLVVEQWGARVTGGVLVHEVCHLIRDHAGRGEELGAGRDHLRWNYATDAAINDDLLSAGVLLPDGVVTPAAMGLPANGIEEQYYALLSPSDASDGGSDGAEQHDTGCGSGAGDPVAAWELPGDDPTSPGLSPGEAALTRRAVAQAVEQYGARGRGLAPAGLRRWASQELTGPTVPWTRVLSSSVRRAVAWARGSHDYTYARPSRRRVPGVITPAMRRPTVTVAVVVDTSASMSESQLSAALAEIQGVIRAAGLGPQGLRVLTCDAASSVQVVRRAADVRLDGGGGTDMRVGIADAQAGRPAPDVIIVLTDGYTPWPEVPIRARLIVGLIGTRTGSTPSWATTVHIETD